MPPKKKPRTIPFDEKISRELDRATIASESDDPTRRKLGKIWKRRLEDKIWRKEHDRHPQYQS